MASELCISDKSISPVEVTNLNLLKTDSYHLLNHFVVLMMEHQLSMVVMGLLGLFMHCGSKKLPMAKVFMITSYPIKEESPNVTKVFPNGTLGRRSLMQFMPEEPAVIEIT